MILLYKNPKLFDITGEHDKSDDHNTKKWIIAMTVGCLGVDIY